MNLQDYELIRMLLQSRLVTTPDVPVDRMAVDMVNRANVYLGMMYGHDQTTFRDLPPVDQLSTPLPAHPADVVH